LHFHNIHRAGLPYCFFIFLLISCKSASVNQSTLQNPDAGQASHSCLIAGKILAVVSVIPMDNIPDSLEAPTTALVEIKSKSRCGNAVVSGVKGGDTISIYFVFSLHPSLKTNPEMKKYPQLKKGDDFEAWMEERIRPGDTFDYRVYGYRKQ